MVFVVWYLRRLVSDKKFTASLFDEPGTLSEFCQNWTSKIQQENPTAYEIFRLTDAESMACWQNLDNRCLQPICPVSPT